MIVKAIVFLGNPGHEYARSRHNYAWMISDVLSAFSGINWQQKFHGSYCRAMIDEQPRVCLKPDTYMNRSGRSVQAMLQFFKWDVDDLLVVHDDLELKLGQAAFKKGGGLGGHNGLRSIAEQMGSRDFFRLRLGIGRPDHGSPADFVLGKFNSDEMIIVDRVLHKMKVLFDETLNQITSPDYRFTVIDVS